MSSRHQPMVKIFQDPVPSVDHTQLSRAQPPSHLGNLRPLQSNASRNGVVFNPPSNGPRRPSPRKTDLQSSSSPKTLSHDQFNSVSIPTPKVPIFHTDSPKKGPVFSTFKTRSIHRPQKALFTTFPSSASVDKENCNPYAIHSDAFSSDIPDPVYGQKGPLKRALLDSAPIKDRSIKRSRTEEPTTDLPDPSDMPLLPDDGTKPPYSYAVLIALSILRAPNRRLTLAQIYKWISDSFSYYRASETGWQNSIRHNLSLNKAFVKQERPKDDPGKGNYWAIVPGTESLFIKEKATRKAPLTEPQPLPPLPKKDMTTNSAYGESIANIHVAPRKAVSFDGVAPLRGEAEPSSDATIPASDPIQEEDDIEASLAAALLRPLQSSPPPMIHSSPPMPRHILLREATPPPALQLPSADNSRTRKRKFASMNDSGYFSSLESSAIRPHTAGGLPNLETDHERSRKRGRAEEEIARIRHSSFDSPSMSRMVMKQPTLYMQSSSPLRPLDNSLMLPPLTPATTFKPTSRPPPSISPNTNLRNHRDKVRALVGSPVRGLGGVLQEDLSCSWTADFNPDVANNMDDSFLWADMNGDWDNLGDINTLPFFADDPLLPNSAFASPEKRSAAKRPRFDRASTTGHILADVTGASNLQPLSKANSPLKFLHSPSFSASPSKSPIKSSNTITGNFDLPSDDVFGKGLFADEDPGMGGIDILQGFQKIGTQQTQLKPKSPRTNGRPLRPAGYNRSLTSRF